MERLLEPELMIDAEQVGAYAQADFSIPHNDFIKRLESFINEPAFNGTALDLGCGPGDISRRFVEAFPLSKVHAIDGSMPMISYAEAALSVAQVLQIRFIHGRLPDVVLPQSGYAVIFSNSLLHHLPNPQVLWQTVRQYSAPGARIIIMDLLRPASITKAQAIVQTYAANEPGILQRDFYHSLLAAFSIEEINAQLAQAKLAFNIEQITDRHVFITGIAP
ncbi:MAG: class I SAM-dependent methyltransferase [Methylovulum sp.]|nr:MAG: class I SAM-dependent methyltransferase [Methylovulum sp.]